MCYKLQFRYKLHLQSCIGFMVTQIQEPCNFTDTWSNIHYPLLPMIQNCEEKSHKGWHLGHLSQWVHIFTHSLLFLAPTNKSLKCHIHTSKLDKSGILLSTQANQHGSACVYANKKLKSIHFQIKWPGILLWQMLKLGWYVCKSFFELSISNDSKCGLT